MTVAPTLDLPILDVRRGDPALVRDLLARPGVLEHGHFELLSGLHSDTFIRFSALARDEEALACVADWLTPSVKPWQADALVAPSTAGVALGWALSRRLAVPLHLAIPDASGRSARLASADALDGQRVALVNDVVTTGAGMEALAEAARATGAEVAGAAWFASRSPVDIETTLAASTACVVALELSAVPAGECELCQREVALERAAELN